MAEVFQKSLRIRAPRRGLHEITGEIVRAVEESGVEAGICNVFVQHTSASLAIGENADPTARRDLEEFLDRLAPENESWYRHTLEGSDDMPSHIKTVVTSVSLSIPVVGGKLGLGTWQGIFLCEHRSRPSARRIVVTVVP